MTKRTGQHRLQYPQALAHAWDAVEPGTLAAWHPVFDKPLTVWDGLVKPFVHPLGFPWPWRFYDLPVAVDCLQFIGGYIRWRLIAISDLLVHPAIGAGFWLANGSDGQIMVGIAPDGVAGPAQRASVFVPPCLIDFAHIGAALPYDGVAARADVIGIEGWRDDQLFKKLCWIDLV